MSTPQFPKRDPADPDFWDLRYSARFAPWDAGKVPRQLRDFVAASDRPRRVLVPGCGSGWDVRFLAESGWDVLGIDFSDAALAAARAVLGPYASRVRKADFFAPVDHLILPALRDHGAFDVVYERALLCALPRRLWQPWAERVAQLLVPGGLLAGFFYFDEGERGPPFPLNSQRELAALLEARFGRIADAAVEDSIAVFQGKERWQVWRRR